MAELIGLPPTAQVERELGLVGSYVDPALARLTAGDWSVQWFDGMVHLKPSTRERYAGILREHILPRWESVRLADVTHAGVQSG